MAEAAATPEGTRAYAGRFAGRVAAGYFRRARDLELSSIGLGTYLGDDSDQDDASYAAAIRSALERGVNVLDTAINYRSQRSERVIGRVLASAIREGAVARGEVAVATKGGYLAFDGSAPRSRDELFRYVREKFFDPGIIDAEDLVGGVHCMTPAYLRHEIGRSLANLGLDTIDIYYLHNPEQQLADVGRDEFLLRIRAAFEALEEAVAKGYIRLYGTATWNGYRVSPTAKEYLSLAELFEIAREVGGDGHRFRVVQLPLNLAMPEAATLANQAVAANGSTERVPFLEAAARLGVTVMCSASILQGRLARGLPRDLERALGALDSNACRALQVVRSAPGVTTALVGMKQVSHVEENLRLAAIPPASPEVARRLLG